MSTSQGSPRGVVNGDVILFGDSVNQTPHVLNMLVRIGHVFCLVAFNVMYVTPSSHLVHTSLVANSGVSSCVYSTGSSNPVQGGGFKIHSEISVAHFEL